MKPITKQSDKKTAFTIIELLTVMSIIIILIGLLVPSLNMVKRYAKEVRQKAQFHSIDSAIELFSGNSGWGGYPPSDALDGSTPAGGVAYCGAMKLCEAMVGQDLMGFHPDSRFRADCTMDGTKLLYDNPPVGATLDPDTATNLKARKGPYLQTDSANAYRLGQLYGAGNTSPFDEDLFVLCDVYNRVKNVATGKGVGMPILYYKANTSNTIHDPCGTLPTETVNKDYIYNCTDNDKLVALGLPWDITAKHPIDSTVNPKKFYEITKDNRINIVTGRPYRPDSYILISAGFDGMYGTDDDVFNFEK
jgi:type II secretory pathway pseudopilin PulG